MQSRLGSPVPGSSWLPARCLWGWAVPSPTRPGRGGDSCHHRGLEQRDMALAQRFAGQQVKPCACLFEVPCSRGALLMGWWRLLHLCHTTNKPGRIFQLSSEAGALAPLCRQPSELSASQLSLGLIQHCAGSSPSPGVVADPYYVCGALGSGRAAFGPGFTCCPSSLRLMSMGQHSSRGSFSRGFRVQLITLHFSPPAAGNKDSHLSRACPGFLRQGSEHPK